LNGHRRVVPVAVVVIVVASARSVLKAMDCGLKKTGVLFTSLPDSDRLLPSTPAA
jgi:hypothetical protein